MSEKSKILVFASGSKEGGGSGFEWLADACEIGLLDAEIALVVSNHPNGGVRRIAEGRSIPFEHLASPRPTAEEYRDIKKSCSAAEVILSGWMRFVCGIRAINIHPGLLPATGGLAGLAVHKKAIQLFHEGKISHTAVTMHFVEAEERYDPSKYDTGPVFFEFPVAIRPDDTPETLGKRVNEVEHGWQAFVTNEVLSRRITWYGTDKSQLITPFCWPHLPKHR